MMHYFSLLLMVIVFPHQSQCQRMECKHSYPNPITNYINKCVQPNKTGPCEMWETYINVMNNQKVDVTFKVTSRNCTLYKFQLKANESMDEMNCDNTSSRYITELHSAMTLNVFDKPCEGMVNVTFEDVPTGCYKLYYCTLRSKSHQICRQIVKYLNTTNIKINEAVKFEVPKLTPQYDVERKEVGITVSSYTKFDEIQLSLRPSNNQFCNSSSRQLTVWIARDVNRRLMCKGLSKDDVCFLPEMAQSGNCHKIECYEEKENNSIKCEFKQIPPGNYCVHMHIDDEKCSECDFHLPFEMKALILPAQDIQSAMPLAFVALAVGVVGLLLTSVITSILICRRRWNNPQRVVIADDDHSWLQSQEILLLYPRDCKPFMDMMSTWRQVMEDMTDCKVFDCFDPHHFENLSLSKMDWMRRHVLRHNMKVVVVETACAALHQRALVQHNKLTYKDPTWLDDLFLLGLKLLTDNSDRNNYQRVFVVSFDGFTGERDSLNYLTPYTRYMIPRYLDLLVADLNVQNFQKNIIRMRDCENENLQRLELELRNLINYRGQNPEYLQQQLEVL